MTKMVWYGGQQIPASQTVRGVCEDAPCCGCCGPGSDDGESFQDRDPYDEEYERRMQEDADHDDGSDDVDEDFDDDDEDEDEDDDGDEED